MSLKIDVNMGNFLSAEQLAEVLKERIHPFTSHSTMTFTLGLDSKIWISPVKATGLKK